MRHTAFHGMRSVLQLLSLVSFTYQCCIFSNDSKCFLVDDGDDMELVENPIEWRKAFQLAWILKCFVRFVSCGEIIG